MAQTDGLDTPAGAAAAAPAGDAAPVRRSAYDPRQKTPVTPELYDYLLAHNPPLDPVQRDLVETTRARLPERSQMQVSEEQGPLLAFLVRLLGARLVVEVGTFTGLSSLSMAQALPADGRIIACDVSEEWTALARDAWGRAGVADRIDLRIGPALETLRALPAEPEVDLAFIDADKENYIAYWDELVPRIRPGGLIVSDNVFFHGQVTESGGHWSGGGDPGVQRPRVGGPPDGVGHAHRGRRGDTLPQALSARRPSAAPPLHETAASAGHREVPGRGGRSHCQK